MPLNKRAKRRLLLLSILGLGLVLTLGSLFVGSRIMRAQRLEAAVRDGMSAHDAGDYVAALSPLQHAVSKNKNNIELVLALADTRLRNVDPKGKHIRGAIHLYEHALGIEPTNTVALNALLDLYAGTGLHAEALAIASRFPHDDLRIGNKRVVILQMAGRDQDALAEAKQLRLIDSNDPRWVFAEFPLRSAVGESMESMRAVADAYAEEHPNNQALALVRISFMHEAGERDNAISAAHALFNLGSTDPEVVMMLHQILLRLGLKDEASEVLDRAHVIAETNATVSRALIDLLWRNGDFPNSRQLAREAARTHPDEPMFLRIAASIAAFDPSATDRQDTFDLLLDEVQARDTAAVIIEQKRIAALQLLHAVPKPSLKESTAIIAAVRELDPSDPFLMILDAHYQLKSGQPQNAVTLLGTVFQKTRARSVGMRLAQALLLQKRYEELLTHSTVLFQLFPAIDTFAIRAQAWIGLQSSGHDPFELDPTLTPAVSIAQRIREAYGQARDTAPLSASILLPLLAKAAAIDGDSAGLDYAIDEALANNNTSSSQLLQIRTIESARNGPRVDVLLERAKERNAPEIEIALINAHRLRNDGKLPEAIALIANVIDAQPAGPIRNQVARRALGFLATSSAADPSAITMMRQLLTDAPDDPATSRILLATPGIWGRFPDVADEAIEALAAITGSDAPSVVIARARRVLHQDSEDPKSRADAVVALNDLLLRSPQSVSAMLVMSDLLRSGPTPDYERAANYLRTALETRPDQVALYPLLIQLLQQVGDHPRALEYLQRYREATSSDSMASQTRIALLLRQGEYAQAIDELRTLALITSDIGDRISLAQLLARVGRLKEALAEYETALASEPDHRLARVGRALLLANTGRLDEALASIEALPVESESARSRTFINLYLAAGETAQALRTAETLVTIDPDTPWTWTILGQLRHRVGDTPGAIDALRRALAIDGSHTDALGQLVPLLLADTDNWDEARQLLISLASSAPGLAASFSLAMDASDQSTGQLIPEPKHLQRARALIEEYPGSMHIREQAWRLHTTARDFQRALEIATEAITEMPSYPRPAELALASAMRIGAWEQAIDLSYELRKRSQPSKQLERNLHIARLCIHLRRNSEASIVLDPYHGDLYSDDLVYAHVDRATRRADLQRPAVGRLPAQLRALVLETMLRNGRIDRAYTLFRPLFSTHPELLGVWISTALSLNVDTARLAFDRIELVLGNDAAAQNQMLGAWVALAQKTKDPGAIATARQRRDAVLQANPTQARELESVRAGLLELEGETASSIAVYRDLLDSFGPEEQRLFVQFRSLDEEQKQTLWPTLRLYVSTLNNMAYQLVFSQANPSNANLIEALGFIDQALASAFGASGALRAECLDTRAAILSEMDNDHDALAAIKRAQKLAPARVSFRIREVAILFDLGRRADAAQLGNTILEELIASGRPNLEQVQELRKLIES